MLSKKAIKSKIANLEGKLKPLYKQIDQLCSQLTKTKSPNKTRALRSSSSKGRGRPPKEGIQKLSELENKLRNQSKKVEQEIDTTIRNIQKNIKDLTAEIEQKKMILNRI